MSVEPDLNTMIRLIGAGEGSAARQLLVTTPGLATARIERTDEFFVEECHAQIYAGDTALHAAAFAYDTGIAGRLLEAGADVHARNRRGGEPLHSATRGGPGSPRWSPTLQVAMIEYLIGAGADPNALATGGVTPLHRAVRNRCSAAVDALLRHGADRRLANDSGSTAFDLAHWTTGRGGSGSPEARAEQQRIVDRLADTSR